MIIHVFTADRFHLVPKMVESFYALEDNQFFILARNKKDKKDKIYDEIFKDKSHYIITHSNKELINIALKLRSNKFVLHGVPYLWMILFLFVSKKVNWVCWGAGASKNKNNWKSVIFHPFKKKIYKSFTKIGVLMPQDRVSLNNDFGVKNAILLSYFGSIGSFPYTIEDLNKKEVGDNLLKKVYLGNNSSSINTYLPLIEKLSKFKDDIFINCMINYSFKENDISLKLREMGANIYGDRFYMDETLYSLEDYYKYMNECDIYICGVKKQTGLGAIYTILRQGKKAFLTGKNYELINNLGCTVFKIEDLDKITKAEFKKPLSLEQKVINFKIITEFLDKDRLIREWLSYIHD